MAARPPNFNIMNVPTHKIITWLLIFFVFGIGVSSFLTVPFFIYLPLFLLFLIIWLVIWPKKEIWPAVFLILFFILGTLRYQISFPKIDQSHISYHNGSRVVFRGKVIKEPDQRINGVKITVGDIVAENLPLQGKVLVNIPLYSGYQYGDLVEVNCKLSEPGVFADFDYHEYLARYDIYSTCYWPEIKLLSRNRGNFLYSRVLEVKNEIKNLIDVYFSEPQGSIVSALVLGLKSGVPQKLRDEFSRAGLAHILAVSGLHIGVICLILSRFFNGILGLRRQKAFYLTVLIIFIFVVLIGFPVSAVRAAIMGTILLYGKKIGRPGDFFRILVATCFLMLLFNPKILKSDPGFQLSFMAVLGIALFGDYFSRLFKKVPDNRHFPLRYYLSMSLSAQILVFPLILYHFGTLSLAVLLSNVLVLAILPLVMIFTFVFILGGLIWSGLAGVLIWPAWLLLSYIIAVAEIFSKIPLLSYQFSSVSLAVVFILYFFIAVFFLKIASLKSQGGDKLAAEVYLWDSEEKNEKDN